MALVCWSGGLDSTLMLQDLLREQKFSEPVRTLTIHHCNVGAFEEQKSARTKLRKHFEKCGHKLECLEVEVKSTAGAYVQGRGIPQAVVWLTLGAQYLNDAESLYLGYIKGDCFWHYSGWANQLFAALCAMLGKTCTLQTPLEWVKKEDVIARLGDLVPKCFWCETPRRTGRPCGVCTKCREITQAKAAQKLDQELFKRQKTK